MNKLIVVKDYNHPLHSTTFESNLRLKILSVISGVWGTPRNWLLINVLKGTERVTIPGNANGTQKLNPSIRLFFFTKQLKNNSTHMYEKNILIHNDFQNNFSIYLKK